MTYSIVGDDKARSYFSVDSQTGRLSVARSLNDDSSTSYTVGWNSDVNDDGSIFCTVGDAIY